MQQIPLDITICLAIGSLAIGVLIGLCIRPGHRRRMPPEAYFQPDYSEKPELRVARRVA